jgi:hypothetical protein
MEKGCDNRFGSVYFKTLSGAVPERLSEVISCEEEAR